MNPSTIALIIAGASVVTSLSITLIYYAGRNTQARVDEEIINTLMTRIHNLTIKEQTK